MKIVLDRRSCTCYDQSCETHFGWHFLRDEVTPVDCTLQIIDDGRPEREFLILDRDGVDRTLVVNEGNWADAYDAWRLVWEQQQAGSPDEAQGA